MTHLMRHTLSRIVAITGAMMVAGCASFKSGSGPNVNPSFDGEGSGGVHPPDRTRSRATSRPGGRR